MADHTIGKIITSLMKKAIFYELQTTEGQFRSDNGYSVLVATDMTNVQ